MTGQLEGIKQMAKRLDVPVSWLYGKTRRPAKYRITRLGNT